MQEPAFSVKLIGNACKSEEQRFNKQTQRKTSWTLHEKQITGNPTSNQDVFY